jgi:uncharacterized protein
MIAHELMTVLGQAAATAAVAAIGCLVFRIRPDLRWAAAALALYVLYDGLLTRLFFALPAVPAGSDWNWLGKVLAIAGMVAVAALPQFGFARSGLTLRQKPGWGAGAAVIALLSGLFFYLAATDGQGPADVETIAFQWTMPGLDEEIFYRGVLLLALNEAFKPRADVLGAPVGLGGLLTSVLFGLAHALGYDESGYGFDAMTFLMTGGPALILVWVRERTGSVLLPIIGHNVANGASTIL